MFYEEEEQDAAGQGGSEQVQEDGEITQEDAWAGEELEVVQAQITRLSSSAT